jgi:hypothetical protein
MAANGLAGNTITIYMNFMPSAVMTSDTTYTGEAPQLPGQPSYGYYDNGAKVLSDYSNFGATPLNGWYVSAGSGTYVADDGLTISGDSNSPLFILNSSVNPLSPYIVDTYAESISPDTDQFTLTVGYTYFGIHMYQSQFYYNVGGTQHNVGNAAYSTMYLLTQTMIYTSRLNKLVGRVYSLVTHDEQL